MTGSNIDRQLAQARVQLRRLNPGHAAAALNAGALLVDIRPGEQRKQEGEVPGATILDRNVLEWRLDPTSEHRVAEIESCEQVVVLLCSEGYASSLAAASLQAVGLRSATDVIGGFRAWVGAGLPTTKT